MNILNALMRLGRDRMKKPREFWISQTDADDEANYAGEALFKHPRQGPLLWQSCLVHVIEKSAYDQLLANARELQKALGHYQSSHYDHKGNACYADSAATKALETFTKKYGSAE